MKTSIRMKSFVCLLVLFFVNSGVAFAFKPFAKGGHTDIIKNALKDFKGQTFSDKAITLIIYGNRYVDSVEILNSAAHFDNEDIRGGAKRLVDIRDEIINEINNTDIVFNTEVQFKLGRALHTLQDFYAHTNWVDGLKKDKFNQ